ncbi:MAG: acyl-CoA thioesterase [Rhodospirillaceae bacterium]|nr:acyl-CoA thioesterase [Rhodospirillaceae bacterium]MBT6139853.1 acyl-CoA thioesterase [Rhodospirillaceae bacterium]
MSVPEPREERRADFRWQLAIPTRWIDNDIYGHVNNVQYYSFFDTAVAAHLIEFGGLDMHNSPVIGFVVETKCQYFRPICFPDVIDAAIRVVKIGRSSVTYEIGLFRQGDEEPAAVGHFVHVYVERETNRSTEIPDERRRAMEAIRVG